MTLPRKLTIWLLAYVATMALLFVGLRGAREKVISWMGNPESLAAWRDWAEETRRPLEPGQPVARRPVKSDEPPFLILMRDHFGAVQAVSLAISSFLFAFMGFVGHGLWTQRHAPPLDESRPARR
jgi:hypothetical protein